MRLFLFTIISFLINSNILAQGCCSGGAGSPIAGGAATGVLQENQMEISLNYQFNQSNKFFNEHKEAIPLFSDLSSDYLFFRTDYGVSKKLTLSIASGYYLDKSLIETDNADTTSSSGLGDLIIFPRYSIYNKTTNFKRTEIAIGLGLKIPLGAHNDSTLTYSDQWIGDIYQTNPPTVQTTSGSNDFMFYSFFFREFQKRKLRLFMTALHVKKGFNPSGIKYGDYTSIGFFASKTFFYRWGVTSQIKAENIGQIKAAENIDLEGFYNISPESTGSKKWFFIPQLSYSQNGLTVFATSEIPLYQYLNGTQVGSQHQFTFGVNYRFLTKECKDPLPSLN
jgi:hypothetical protein